MHLTLKFIGDVQTSHMEELRKAVATVCTRVAPLRVVIARLGCFPSNASPRVIWAGIAEGAPDLRSLARQIDDALGALGYPRDTRPFSAHITVARADKRAIAAELTALGRSVGSWPEATFGELVVQSVSVVQSDLHPSGPIYTNICTVPLQGLPGSLDAPHTAY